MKRLPYLLLFSGLFFFDQCSNSGSSSSQTCMQKCRDKGNLCFLAIGVVPRPETMGCFFYKASCETQCYKNTNTRTRTRSSSSSSRTRTSSSSSSSGGSSSSSGHSGGGHGGGGIINLDDI